MTKKTSCEIRFKWSSWEQTHIDWISVRKETDVQLLKMMILHFILLQCSLVYLGIKGNYEANEYTNHYIWNLMVNSLIYLSAEIDIKVKGPYKLILIAFISNIIHITGVDCCAGLDTFDVENAFLFCQTNISCEVQCYPGYIFPTGNTKTNYSCHQDSSGMVSSCKRMYIC